MTEPAGPILVGGAIATSVIVATAFTAPEWVTIIVAIIGGVTVVGGVAVNIIVALRTRAVAVETKEAVAEVHAQGEVIKGSVNGAAHASLAKIEALQREITLLREDKAEKKEMVDTLMQAVATSTPAPVKDVET